MEFQKMTLGELAIGGKGSYGIAASAIPYNKKLFTYLRITDINDDGTLNRSSLMSIDNKKAERYLLKPNDIVFARTGGSTGRNYFYDGTDGEFVFAGFLIKFSIDETKVNPRFIKYYCLSQKYKGWVHSFNTGSTRGNINAQTYANMPILLPPRKQQDFLVDILSIIDEKIKYNIAINNNLLEQALTLFKEYFINNNTTSKMLPLYEFAEYVNGAAFKPEELNGIGLPIIKIAELKSGITDSTRYFSGNKDIKYLVSDKDILFSWSGNPETSIDIFIWALGEGILNQHTFKVKSKFNCHWFTYLLLKYHKPIFTHIARNKQTTGLGHITATDLKRLTFPFDLNKIQNFETLISSIMELYFNNLIENQNLIITRNTLLPKLMSGQLDISNISI